MLVIFILCRRQLQEPYPFLYFILLIEINISLHIIIYYQQKTMCIVFFLTLYYNQKTNQKVISYEILFHLLIVLYTVTYYQVYHFISLYRLFFVFILLLILSYESLALLFCLPICLFANVPVSSSEL